MGPRRVDASPSRRKACYSAGPADAGACESGEVAERLKAHAWKVCIRPKGVSRVRIPPPPPRAHWPPSRKRPCLLPSAGLRLGREVAAEREMQVHALHATLALHSE